MALPSAITPPSEAWVDRLQRGHYIWLTKEKEHARVAFMWLPPSPGGLAGSLGIRRYRTRDGELYFWGIEDWFVDNYGRGLDGLPLIAPCRGNLPAERPDIPEAEVLRIDRAIEQLTSRLVAQEHAHRQETNLLRTLIDNLNTEVHELRTRLERNRHNWPQEGF